MTATTSINPKRDTIQMLQAAIGDGNIRVHFRHIHTATDRLTKAVSYLFEVNGVAFRTGLYDAEHFDFLSGMNGYLNDYLINTHSINLVLWYVAQHDTVAI